MDYNAALDVFFADGPSDVRFPDRVTNASPARRLRDSLEPVAMHAVWSPSTNAALGAKGYDFLNGYLTGRAAVLGKVPSSVVAAAFGVFEPGLVDTLWTQGRSLLSLPELIELRDRETAASLRAVIGDDEATVDRVAEVLETAICAADGAGRVMFSALRAQPRLTDPYGRLWRATDLVREHRGDGHLAACISAGLDAVRMGVLMEAWLGYPVGEYSNTRAWPPEASQSGVAHLEADGLLAGGVITDAGRATRDGIEDATDASQASLLAAIGDDLDFALKALDGWSARCVEAGTFPPDVRKRAAG